MIRVSLKYFGLIATTAISLSSAAVADDVAKCQVSDPYRDGEATYNVCNRVIEAAKTNDLVKAKALAQRGEAYYWAGQFRAAISDFDAAIAISPELNETRMQRGWARIQTSDMKSAYRDFTDAFERNPKSGRAVFALAFLAQNREVTVKGYEQALALTPDYYLAEGNLAAMEAETPTTYASALKRYDRLLALGKKTLNTVRFASFGGAYFTKDYYNDVVFARAQLLFNMDRFEDALKEFRKLQVLSKYEPFPYIREAGTLFALKDYVAAASVGENALKVCTESGRLFMCGRPIEIMVSANRRLGKNEEVINRKDDVDNLNLDDYSRGMIALNLAQAYKSLGRLDEARVAFKRVGELRPDMLKWISYPMLRLGYYQGIENGVLDERFWNGLEACLLDVKCVVDM